MLQLLFAAEGASSPAVDSAFDLDPTLPCGCVCMGFIGLNVATLQAVCTE